MIDMKDQQFGLLTAKEFLRMEKGKGAIWRCECSCGGEKEVPAQYLRNGHTRSCGCLVKEIRARGNIKDQRFGLLVAEEFKYFDEKKKAYWEFACDCGNKKVLSLASVKWGRVRSCGCLQMRHITELNRQDITDERFDRLRALWPTEERDESGSIIWMCVCDCGNEVKHSVNKLRSGRIHSCGCMYRETRKECSSHRRDLKDETAISALLVAKTIRRNNTSGYTGVYRDKKHERWQAYISVKKKRYYLGSYEAIEEAAAARSFAEEKLHDPIILQYYENLTPAKREMFFSYLKGKERNGDLTEDGPRIVQE